MADVKMPQLGESVTEGTIGKWLKQVGDTVSKYEPLCEVVTDKVNAEVPSDFEGTLTEILVEEGQTVAVGTLICRIVGEGAATEVSAPVNAPTASNAPASVVSQAAAANTGAALLGGARFSPAVMRLIQEHGLDPARIPGTGAGGRITRKDVLTFVESGAHLTKTQEDLSSVAAPTMPATGVLPLGSDESTTQASAPTKNEARLISLADGDTAIEVTPIRRTIAKRMVESKHQAPHAWMMVEIDVSNLAKFRDTAKNDFKKREGISLTYLPFFIKSVVETLKEFPILNSTWADDKIIMKKRINISIAVASDTALFVPVIHDADRLSILGIAHAINDLARKARIGKLTTADITGGTFTVNNTGAFGSIMSAPIINSPQAAILSMESVVKKPVVLDNDAIAIRSMMNMCMSLDHRVLDGLVCGQFMKSLKARLEGFDENTVSLY